MKHISTHQGISTLVTHFGEGDNPYYAHLTPIYQTSTFGFPDAETAGKVFAGDREGYVYTRADNPNPDKPEPTRVFHLPGITHMQL